MTRTLFAERFDGELFGLVWERGEIWDRLLVILELLDKERVALGEMTGELQLDVHGDPPGEIWPVTVNAVGRAELRKRVNAATRPVPWELRLRCQPLVFLADERIDAVGIDTGDDWELGDVPLVPANEVAAPAGLTAWRVVGEPAQGESLLTLDTLFVDFEEGSEIGMSVTSHYDLWRPETLEGHPNEPHGRANARMLVEHFQTIARASNARMRDRELRINELVP